MRRVAAIFVVLTLALSLLLAFKLRAQAAEQRGPSGGSGEIEGTEVNVASKLSARIVQLHVAKGAQVKKGDLLVTLDCADPRAQLAEAQSRLEALQEQARASIAAAEAAQGSQQAANAGTLAARAQAAALAAQRDAARRQAKRLEAVGNDVAVSSRDQIRSSAEGLEHQLEAAEASQKVSDAQANAALGQWRAAVFQAKASESNARAAEAPIARAKILVAECEIRAPRDAEVEDLPFEVGELVAPGAVLVRLIDLSEVKAIFYLPNAELAAVKTGAKAEVVADAFPGRTFSGTVKTVALKAEFTPRNIQTRSDRDRLVYPVEVWLANPDRLLRAGMPVQVTIPGTERQR